jgi:hypothetical protein
MSLAGASCGAPAAARPARRLAARAPRRVAARPPPAAASPRCSAAGRSLRAAAIGPEGSSPAFPAAYTVRLPRTPRHAAWRRGGNAGVIACPHVHSRAFRENTRRRNPAERTHVRARLFLRAAGDGAGLAVPTHAQAVAGRGGQRAAEQGGRD